MRCTRKSPLLSIWLGEAESLSHLIEVKTANDLEMTMKVHGDSQRGGGLAHHNVHRKLIHRELKLKQEKSTEAVIIKQGP